MWILSTVIPCGSILTLAVTDIAIGVGGCWVCVTKAMPVSKAEPDPILEFLAHDVDSMVS
jgi:hypothetical protein